jgi:predicted CopG family antitoxin
VGRRTITVSEDVYRRLSRLAVERNKTINDIIEELLNNYEGGVGGGSIVEGLNEVKAMLRDCLNRLGVRQPAENKPIEINQPTKTVPAGPKNETGDSAFEDNPWIQILRAKYGS